MAKCKALTVSGVKRSILFIQLFIMTVADLI